MANAPTLTGSGKTHSENIINTNLDLFNVTSASFNTGGNQFTNLTLTITNSKLTDTITIGSKVITLNPGSSAGGTSGDFNYKHIGEDNTINYQLVKVGNNLELRFSNLERGKWDAATHVNFLKSFVDSMAYKIADTTDVQATRTIDITFLQDNGNGWSGDPNSSNPELTATIAKNHAPTTGEAQSFSVLEDKEIAYNSQTAPQYKIIGSDSDNDVLTYALKFNAGAQHGALVVNTDGTFSYAPIGDYFGPDSFTVVITDKYGATVEKLISLTVDPVNDAPTLTAVSTGPADYLEGSGPKDLFNDVAISTVESGQKITEIVVTAHPIVDGADEILVIDGVDVSLVDGEGDTGDFGGPINVHYVITVDPDTSIVTVKLSHAGLDPDVAETLVDGLAYKNTDELTPSEGLFWIDLTSISDDGGVADGGVNTTPLSISTELDFGGVNDAPTLVATGKDVDVLAGFEPVALFTDVSVDTVEAEQDFKQIVVTVAGVKDGTSEALVVDGIEIDLVATVKTPLGVETGVSYTVEVNGETGLVTVTFNSEDGISGSDLLNAILAGKYDNDSAAPTLGERTISIVSLTDTGGTADGGEDTATFDTISSVVEIVAPSTGGGGGGGGGSTNTAPTLVTPNTDATVQAGAALNLTIGDTHFVDPEGTDLNYSITVEGAAAPSWISFNTATGALTANPTSANAGQFTVVVTASDGSLTTSDEFELIVTAPAAQNIRGTRGDDRNLIGGDGDDTINGKKGNDRMTGGDGADTFVFSAGHDKVVDFDGTEGDLIDLGKAKGIKDFEDLMANHVKDTDAGLKIIATDGSSMFLKGVDADDLTADMFIF